MVMATVTVGQLRKRSLSLRNHSYNKAMVMVTVTVKRLRRPWSPCRNLQHNKATATDMVDHRLSRPWLPRRNLPHSRATATDRVDRLKGSLKGRRKEKSNDDDWEITDSVCGSPAPDRSRLQGQWRIRDVGLDVG